MKGKKRIIIIAVVVVLAMAVAAIAVFFPLLKNKDDANKATEESTEPTVMKVDFPATYELNGIKIPALHVAGMELENPEEPDETEQTEQTKPEETTESQPDPSEDPTAQTDPSEPEDPNKPYYEQERISATYVYHNFPNLQESLTEYVTRLTSGQGYFVVDEDMVKQKAKKIETSEGTRMLAKTGEKEGTVLHLELNWQDTECTVVVSNMPGEIKEPERPDPTKYFETHNAISMLQAKEFIWGLPPSVLELDGQSMEGYRVYTSDVDAIVDGYPCIRLHVFKRDGAAGTNEAAGEYCLSRDGKHLYLIEPNSNRARELKIPEGMTLKADPAQ